MAQIETLPELDFLSELYAQDAPDARLLAEYPSSNSEDTAFQNKTKYIIHDPFPPPRVELLKTLGPHHLMCGWGKHVKVTSQIAPPQQLLDHWQRIFGNAGVPDWQPIDLNDPKLKYITLFPHQSLAASRQVIDPDVNYEIHSKEVIGHIDCPQADILSEIEYPCIVKLSHGYAGLGNFLIRNEADEESMRKQLTNHWPDAVLVNNSIIENINGDYGVQFYLRRDGSAVWIGFTEQHFDDNKKWCGGTYSADLQSELFDDLCKMVEPAAQYLHTRGYFGLVGIDILRNTSGQLFLVDVNPRLTGITPFLMASGIFARDGLNEGVYNASCNFKGSLDALIRKADETTDARVVVMSAFEDKATNGEPATICHLSVTSKTQAYNQQILRQLF